MSDVLASTDITTEEQATNAINWIEKSDTAEQEDIHQYFDGELEDIDTGAVCMLGLGGLCASSPVDLRAPSAYEEIQHALGLINEDGSPGGDEWDGDSDLTDIIRYNDFYGKTFPQIAQVLKDNAEAYFIPEVAELINEHFNKREVAA